MFRNGCLEGIEALMAEGEIYDIDYTGWIPVSERLPKTGDSVLVTYSDGEVSIVWDARPKAWGKYEKANNLIFPVAWMPLPDPWNGGEEE